MSTKFAGPAYIANLNSEQRINDKRDEIILRDIADAPLQGILRKRGQKRKVGDYKPFWWEDHPLAYKGTLTGNSSGSAGTLSTTATEVLITGASTLFTNRDLLAVPRYQANNSNTSKLFGAEIMPIVSISGSVVTVQRNNASSTSTYNVSTAVAANTLNFVRLAASNPEGAGVGVSRGHNVENKYGFLQYYEKVWDITRELDMTVHYGKPERERRKGQALNGLLREIDNSFCWGELKELTEDSQSRPQTQGVVDRITKADTDAATVAWAAAYDLVTGDGTSRVWNVQNQFTPENWKKFVVQVGEYVTGKRVLGLHGKYFLPKMESLFDGQVRYDKPDMKDPGLTVLSYTSNGVIIDFVHWPALDFGAAYYDLVCLDMDHLNIAMFEDIHHEDIDPNGAQKIQGHFIGKMGLQIENALAHSLLTNMAA